MPFTGTMQPMEQPESSKKPSSPGSSSGSSDSLSTCVGFGCRFPPSDGRPVLDVAPPRNGCGTDHPRGARPSGLQQKRAPMGGCIGRIYMSQFCPAHSLPFAIISRMKACDGMSCTANRRDARCPIVYSVSAEGWRQQKSRRPQHAVADLAADSKEGPLFDPCPSCDRDVGRDPGVILDDGQIANMV